MQLHSFIICWNMELARFRNLKQHAVIRVGLAVRHACNATLQVVLSPPEEAVYCSVPEIDCRYPAVESPVSQGVCDLWKDGERVSISSTRAT